MNFNIDFRDIERVLRDEFAADGHKVIEIWGDWFVRLDYDAGPGSSIVLREYDNGELVSLTRIADRIASALGAMS